MTWDSHVYIALSTMYILIYHRCRPPVGPVSGGPGASTDWSLVSRIPV